MTNLVGLLRITVAFAVFSSSLAAVNRIDFDRIADSTYDAIVVGGGTSGCVLAETLGEAGLHVLLIERGYDNQLLPSEAGLATSLLATPTAMIDETLAEIVFTKDGVPYINGRTLGGMSAINFGAYAEEDPSYFEMLEEDYGVEIDEIDWSKATDYIRNSGILSASPTIRESFFNDWVISDKKVADLHGEFSTDESSPADGRAPLSYSAKVGQVARTFSMFNPTTNQRRTSCSLLNSPNIDLAERTTVQSVVFDEDLGPAHRARATCVLAVHGSDQDMDSETKACIRTGGKIILTAGVINTPVILMRSGIGDSESLSEVGVKSVVHNPDVGMGFHDKAISANTAWPLPELSRDEEGYANEKSFNSHMGIRKLKCEAADGKGCPVVTYGELTGGTTFAVFAGLLAEKRSKSPTTSSLFKSILKSQAMQLYQRVRARLSHDLRGFLSFLTFSKIDEEDEDIVPNNSLDKFTNLVACSKDTIATTVFLSEPRSRGKVTLDVNLDPVLEGVYFSNEQDMEDMIDAVERVIEHISSTPVVDRIHERGSSCLSLIEDVMVKAMLSSHQRSELYPSNSKSSHPFVNKDIFPPMPIEANRDKIKTLIEVFFLPAWHGTSTAAMGKVVGNDFGVKGVDQLSIIDASVLPQSTRVDPLATLLALGRYGGKKILEEIDRSEKREFQYS